MLRLAFWMVISFRAVADTPSNNLAGWDNSRSARSIISNLPVHNWSTEMAISSPGIFERKPILPVFTPATGMPRSLIRSIVSRKVPSPPTLKTISGKQDRVARSLNCSARLSLNVSGSLELWNTCTWILWWENSSTSFLTASLVFALLSLLKIATLWSISCYIFKYFISRSNLSE